MARTTFKAESELVVELPAGVSTSVLPAAGSARRLRPRLSIYAHAETREATIALLQLVVDELAVELEELRR